MIIPGLHLVPRSKSASTIDVSPEDLEEFWSEESRNDPKLAYGTIAPIDLTRVNSGTTVPRSKSASTIDVSPEDLEEFWSEESRNDPKLAYGTIAPIDLTRVNSGTTWNLCTQMFRDCLIKGIRLRGVEFPGLRPATGLLVKSIQCHGRELLNGYGRVAVEHLNNMSITFPDIVRAGESLALTVEATEASPANAVVGCYLVEYTA